MVGRLWLAVIFCSGYHFFNSMAMIVPMKNGRLFSQVLALYSEGQRLDFALKRGFFSRYCRLSKEFPMIRALIADDHPIMREGLKLFLVCALDVVVDEVEDGFQAVEYIKEKDHCFF